MKLYFDLETYSPISLKKHGANAYAEKAEILLFAYAFDDGPVTVHTVKVGMALPNELIDAAQNQDIEWWGHGSTMFDWVVLKNVMPWLDSAVPLNRRFDTMVQSYMHSLPGALDSLCQIFKLEEDQRKMKVGKSLIQLFCVPPGKTSSRGRATAYTHPNEWQQFVRYAASDIISMRILHNKMPKWNYPNNVYEMKHQQMDARMNQRGMRMDIELAKAAVEMVAIEKKRLASRTVKLTEGEVESATKRDQMLRYILAEYGVDLPNMQAKTLERRINDQDLPAPLRELLAVRLQASTASVAKYQALLRGISSDGRLRGTIQFCGAARTGRWAHRGFQPGNLARVPKYIAKQWEHAIDTIKTGTTNIVFDNVMEVVGSCVRGSIIAPPGKKLVVSDLSNIEGRVLPWLAGEEWKLKAFQDFDNGVGHDLYKLSYGKTFGVKPEDVDDYMRQLGKVLELAFGFGGGVGAFVTFALGKVDLDMMAERAFEELPTRIVAEAESFYDWFKKQGRSTFNLSRKTFVTIDGIKRAWREAHPNIVSFWDGLGHAFIRATNKPGIPIKVRRLSVDRVSAWLRIRLPSGRYLCYPSPKVEGAKTFSYMGINQYTRKWERIQSYGPKLVENVTQAVARDQLAWGMLKAEAAGYPPITSIHDEAPTEVEDKPEFTHEELSGLLASRFDWNEGLPLAAAGFEAYRYRK